MHYFRSKIQLLHARIFLRWCCCEIYVPVLISYFVTFNFQSESTNGSILMLLQQNSLTKLMHLKTP